MRMCRLHYGRGATKDSGASRKRGPGNQTEHAYFYGAYGELLGNRIYLGGRLIGRGGYVGEAILTDRLGSVGGAGKYYPYGQERQTTPQDTEKFATYYRDATGLGYAWNRHYTSTWGRFLQADPYVSPDALKNPQGWNRYAYVVGDPVNFNDPTGRDPCYGGECLVMDVANALYSSFGDPFREGYWAYVARVMAPSFSRQYDQWLTWTFGGWKGWGQSMDACAEVTLEYLRGFNIEPASPQFNGAGGIRWQVSPQEADALAEHLKSQGFTVSSWTGALHADDVGGDNTDYRSLTGVYNGRSVQIVIAKEQNWQGLVYVYADTDRFNPNEDIGSFLGHLFFEVLPGFLGINTSCWGVRP